MAGTIFPTSVVVSTDGKTVTGGFGGGTAPYSFPYTTDFGWFPMPIPGFNGQQHHITALTTNGTTWTATLSTPIGQGETLSINWNTLFNATPAKITDAVSGTPSNTAGSAIATNNSTVPVRTITFYDDQDKIDVSGFVYGTSTNPAFGNLWSQGDQADPNVAFVTDATEIAAISYTADTLGSPTIDGAAVTPTQTANGFWNLKNMTPSGALATGDHLVIVPNNFGNSKGFRLAGGTRAVKSVARRKSTLRAAVTAPTGFPLPNSAPVTATAPVANLFGNYGIPGTASNAEVNGGQGFGFEFGFTGSGVELVHVVPNNFEVTIDGAKAQRPAPTGLNVGGGEAHNNLHMAWPMVDGLTRAAAHTLSVLSLAGSTCRGVIVNNGTAVSSATTAGATSIPVGDSTAVSVGDWIRVGTGTKREYRKVTAIGGGALTVAALTNAHPAGDHVSSFSAPTAPALTAYNTGARTRRIACIGDSNLQAHSEYGFASTLDPDLNIYPIPYDIREGPVGQMCIVRGFDYINMAVQGTWSTQQITQSTQLAAALHGNLADVIFFWPGVNDTGQGITQAQFQTNCQTIITNVLPSLTATGKIVLMPPGTASTNGTTGLGDATIKTILETLAQTNGPRVVCMSALQLGITAADKNGLHYFASGRKKVRDLVTGPALGGGSPLTAGFFAA